jgi:hypothetical protein
MSILRSIKGAIHVHEHSERQGVDSEDESGVVIWPGPIYLRIRLTGAASNLFVGLPCTQSLPRDSFLFKMIQFELSEAVRSRYQIPLDYRPKDNCKMRGQSQNLGTCKATPYLQADVYVLLVLHS